MASDPAAPHPYARHHDRKPGCAVCGLVKADQVHNGPIEPGQPRQLAMARLMELTPELRAHYACAPGTCDHPDCQL